MPETATAPQESPITQTPQPVRRDFLTRITPERSRLMAERRRQLKAERLEAAKQSVIQAQLQAQEIALMRDTQREAQSDPFYGKTLTRVRAMITRLQEMLETEEDPNKIDRLSSSLAKHEEVERRISDRSLPAVRRVQDQGKPSRASSLLGD